MAESNSSGSFGDRRQLTIFAAAAIGIALLMSILWFTVFRTQYVPAFSQLKPDDAALIVGELDKRKTQYQLANGGATILVPADQVDAARVEILGGGLPLKGTVGFELFNKSDMGLTEFAQKINYQRALQGELARTLMALDTVEDARVHISLPEDGVFRDEIRPAKASITLAPKIGATIGSRAIIGIQRLVASAVDGLDARNVVVLDGSGRQLSGDVAEFAGQVATVGLDPLEQAYAAQVRAALLSEVHDEAMRVIVTAPPGAQPIAGPSESAARRYPLRITVLLTREPEAGLRERLLALLRSEIGFGQAPGDNFELAAAPGTTPYEVGTPMATARGAPPMASPVTEPGLLGGWGLVLAVIALAIVAAAAYAIGRRKARLSEHERAAFAEKLRDLLAERTGSVRA